MYFKGACTEILHGKLLVLGITKGLACLISCLQLLALLSQLADAKVIYEEVCAGNRAAGLKRKFNTFQFKGCCMASISLKSEVAGYKQRCRGQ